jgi:hypothetical protein
MELKASQTVTLTRAITLMENQMDKASIHGATDVTTEEIFTMD